MVAQSHQPGAGARSQPGKDFRLVSAALPPPKGRETRREAGGGETERIWMREEGRQTQGKRKEGDRQQKEEPREALPGAASPPDSLDDGALRECHQADQQQPLHGSSQVPISREG